MLVLDASAAVEILLRTEIGDRALPYLIADVDQLHAPDLLWLEVASALRRAIRLADCTPGRAELALDQLADLTIEAHRDVDLARRAFALRDNLTIYDAVYVSLAETLDATLLTSDAGMASAAGRTCEVVLVN